MTDLIADYYAAIDDYRPSMAYAKRHGLDLNHIRPVAGILAIIGNYVFIEVIGSDAATTVDLCCWPENRPECFACEWHSVPMLGVGNLHQAQITGTAVRVYSTPLAWLQEGCAGIVMLDDIAGARIAA